MAKLTYILLGPRRRIGKDTFAKMLVEELSSRGVPVYQRSFAQSLREEVEAAMGTCSELRTTSVWTEEEALKENVTRPILIAWGQARRFFDPNCWVEKVLEFANYLRVRDGVKQFGTCYVVVPDWRFPNEVEQVREEAAKRGDNVIAIVIKREAAPPGTPDEVKNGPLCDALADRILCNDGTLDELRTAAASFAFELTDK